MAYHADLDELGDSSDDNLGELGDNSEEEDMMAYNFYPRTEELECM